MSSEEWVFRRGGQKEKKKNNIKLLKMFLPTLSAKQLSAHLLLKMTGFVTPRGH